MFTCTACLRRCISSLTADTSYTTAPSLFHCARSTSAPISGLTPLIPSSNSNNTRPRSLRRPNVPFIRTAVTLRGLSKGHHIRTALQTLKNANSINGIARNATRNPLRASRRENKNVVARQTNSEHLNTDQGARKLQLQSEKEAVFLIDPLQLAETVRDNLRKDDFDKAYNLVLASDRVGLKRGVPQGGVRNIVSWNHLIDWTMARHEYTRAMQIYQGMKKRGHVPDSHTYLLILRGLGEGVKSRDELSTRARLSRGVKGMNRHEGNKYLVTQAMEVYNSIFRPNSEVQVKTLHSNALINVLARAGDMDALWGVTGRLPEKGHGSPDHWTYTTILNAMQQDLLLQMRKAMDGQVSQEEAKVKLDGIVENVIGDARQLWRDVVIRWRSVQLQMDEKLVAAMGRLLLMSKKPGQVQDVFALVRQTMGVTVNEELISRMRKELEEAAVVEAKQKDIAAAGTEAHKSEEASLEQDLVQEYPAVDDASVTMALQVFEHVPVGVNATANHALYAKPSNNTLSFLLEAATLLRRPAVGKAYWELLTAKSGPYRVVPDSANLMNYLRLLRISRSSQAALDVLQSEWEGGAAEIMKRRGTFVVAMSTCVRDKSNPNAFSIASRMLDVMQDHATDAQIERDEEAQVEDVNRQTLPPGTKGPKRAVAPMEALPLDPKVLQMYLDLAMFTTKGINSQSPLSKLPSGDLDYVREPTQNNTMRALARLRPDVVNIRRMLNMALEQVEYQKKIERLPANLARQRRRPLGETAEKSEELLALLQTIISAYDRILAVNFRLEEDGLGPLNADVLSEVRLQKAKMADYVRRLKKAMIGYLDENAVKQTQRRYDPKEYGESDNETVQASTADPTIAPKLEASRGQTTRPPQFTNTISDKGGRMSREEQYARYSRGSDQFQQHVAGLRDQGKPLSRRQKKFQTWLDAKGDVRGPQPALTREAREREFQQQQSFAPKPTEGALDVLFSGGEQQKFGTRSNASSDRFRKRDEMLAAAAASSSSSSSPPSRTRRGPPMVVTGSGRVVPKRLSRRQLQEREKDRREDSVKRDMVRFGATERTIRDRRAGKRGEERVPHWMDRGGGSENGSERRRKWMPSGEAGGRMGAAAFGSG